MGGRKRVSGQDCGEPIIALTREWSEKSEMIGFFVCLFNLYPVFDISMIFQLKKRMGKIICGGSIGSAP